MTRNTFPVVELFGPTIQGEGPLCGHRSHFIRFGGCPFRCTWCDSMYAVDPAQIKANKTDMTDEEIVSKVMDLDASTWVTFTGGDPVMWDLSTVNLMLQNRHYKTSVETEGHLWADWLVHADQVVVSPKGPSSGMMDKFDESMLQRYISTLGNKMCMKVVVFHAGDLAFAKDLHLKYPGIKMYISVGTSRPDGETNLVIKPNDLIIGCLKGIAEDILKDPQLADVILLPQLHVLIWGQQRGV